MMQDWENIVFLDNGPLTIHLPQFYAPRPTHVKLELMYPIDELTLPWSQLKFFSICLSDMGDLNLCSMVTKLENIEELQIDLGNPEDPVPGPSHRGQLRVVLPHLRKLILCSWESTKEDFPFASDKPNYRASRSLNTIIHPNICNLLRPSRPLSYRLL
jgi:hypothetical protein